jgi:hypothetical protein
MTAAAMLDDSGFCSDMRGAARCVGSMVLVVCSAGVAVECGGLAGPCLFADCRQVCGLLAWHLIVPRSVQASGNAMLLRAASKLIAGLRSVRVD